MGLSCITKLPRDDLGDDFHIALYVKLMHYDIAQGHVGFFLSSFGWSERSHVSLHCNNTGGSW